MSGRERGASLRRFLAWAAVGLVAGGVAVGVGELVAAATGEDSAPAVAVGSWAIRLTPAWLEEFAIRQFGTNDKEALLTGLYVILGLIALVTGLLARRWLSAGAVVVAGFGALGAVAAVTRKGAGTSAVWPSVLGAVAAVGVLALLTSLLRRATTGRPDTAPPPPAALAWADASPDDTSLDNTAPDDTAPLPVVPAMPEAPVAAAPARRWFVGALAGTAAVAAGAGAGGKYLITRKDDQVAAARAAVKLPTPVTAPTAPAEPLLHPNVPGLGPFFTPNADFYRVDTALAVPEVAPASWTLRIHGMVDRPLELTYAQLLALPQEEHDITLTCVSNTVGGTLCGNARWLGTQLAPLLRQAGVHAGADQILCTSTDGMTIGAPTAAVLDGRDALLAVAMNGQTLPIEHGFPARMLIPGLYGYVSATKWVTDLELTTFASGRAYWVDNGWAQQAPVKTASRIDVPSDGASVAAGTAVVAGTAWATHRGVDAVELSIDNGPWIPTTLAASDTPDTWRQWSQPWNATPGKHTLRVRATDATGTVQTAAVQGPIPDGATGYHTITVTVS